MEEKEELKQEQAPKTEAPKDANETSEPPVKSNKKKIFRIVCGVTLLAVVVAYASITFYYTSHFVPGTIISGADCSNLQVDQAREVLETKGYAYTLTVYGRDAKGDQKEFGVVTADDMELELGDMTTEIYRLMDGQNQFLWFTSLFGDTHQYQIARVLSYKDNALKACLASWDGLKEKNMEAPVDAHISEYSKADKGYSVVPETEGNKVDSAKVLKHVKEAIERGTDSLDLVEVGCYVEAKVKEDDAKLLAAVETANKWTSTNVIYDWHGTEVDVDGDVISDWISFEKKEPKLDEEAVADFISDTADELDTYGKKRKFQTSRGTEITIANCRYGWKVDKKEETKNLLETIYDGKTEEKEPVYSVTAVQKGADDIGSSYVEIDLSAQHLFLYDKGVVVLESDFVSGNMSNGNGTPGGIFGVTYKTKNAVLRGDNYETPVNYWMPFNGNIGMHDATWRRAFGGEIYLTSGSHGCINLPIGKAKDIYEYVSTGFPVICYY